MPFKPKNNQPQYPPASLRSVDWAKRVDWTQSAAELSKQLNLDRKRVLSLRRRYAPQTVRKPTLEKWGTIDWSKTNKQIMQEMGAGAIHVSRMRRKYAPDTVQKRTPR